MIATAYRLPFRFEHSEPRRLAAQRVSIQVDFRLPGAEGVVSAALLVFARAAQAGAFGGRDLEPWRTEFVAAFQASNPGEVRMRVDSCRIAPEAWVVLSHLLLRVHKDAQIELVSVLVDDEPRGERLVEAAASTYPVAFTPMPFSVDDLEPEGGGYSFFMSLASPLTFDNEIALNEKLDAWVQVVSGGGYALSPVDPATDYVEPYGDGVVSYDTTVEWAVFKLRADPVAAIDGLINILMCFHVRHQPIALVEIE